MRTSWLRAMTAFGYESLLYAAIDSLALLPIESPESKFQLTTAGDGTSQQRVQALSLSHGPPQRQMVSLRRPAAASGALRERTRHAPV